MKDDLFILEENSKEGISREQQVRRKKKRCYVGDDFSLFFSPPVMTANNLG
jgi:hypothetical protein